MKEFFRKKLVGLKRSPQLIAILLTMVCCCIYTFALSSYSTASQALYQESVIEMINKNFILFNDLGLTSERVSFEVFALFRNPAIYMFIETLFSILLVISFLSVYKKGKRNNFMFSIVLIMIVVMIACNVLYYLSINYYTQNFDEILKSAGYDFNVSKNSIEQMVSSGTVSVDDFSYRELLETVKESDFANKTNTELYSIMLGELKFASTYNVELTAARQSALQNTLIHTIFLVITLVVILLTPVISKLLNKINTSVDDEYDRLMEQKSDEELMIELEDE